jgi:pimeloyl-ACP methyl ester carboxylesterase
MVFSSPPDTTNQAEIINFLREAWRGNFPATDGTTTVSGTFTIKGTYCVPTKSKADTLEVLVHGITYNKTMWAGMGSGSQYDWHRYANSRGYATLALDRLGHGDNPQHPDSVNIVQPQLQVDILHHILASVRSTNSPINALGRAFKNVVFVGHSYGSFIGSALAAQYPADADALILTAYSGHVNFAAMVDADWASAATLNPARFGGLDLGYISLGSEKQRTAAFFDGGFDPAIPPVDYTYQDTLTPGEIGALPAILGPALEFKGAVLVATAVQDALFCEEPAEKCEEHLAAAAEFFPSAEHYDYFAPDNTGHDLTLHYSAQDSFKRVHDWLDAKL